MDGRSEDDNQPALGFKVQVRGVKDGEIEVFVRWLRGHESILFESFCGMLRQQVLKSLPNKSKK